MFQNSHILLLDRGNELEIALNRVKRALIFSKWRKSHGQDCVNILNKIIGTKNNSDNKKRELSEKSSLRDRLVAILEITQSAKPINECLEKIARLEKLIGSRCKEEKLIDDYLKTVEALVSIINLGDLAAQQVKDLQVILQKSTEKWRDAVYLNAYSKSGHSLTDAAVAPEGQLSISVGSNGAIAPAQHVSNASALKASLLGFYFAFWEHVIKLRGGLQLMILDDPQELLDEENEGYLADALKDLVKIDAQLLVTTYDKSFATMIANVCSSANIIEHRSVHPVNISRQTLETSPTKSELEKKRDVYQSDEDNQTLASDYLAECRVFIEARLSDLFIDPAYATPNHKPSLSDYIAHARHLKNTNFGHELFNGAAFVTFCEDPALQENSACLILLNKAHHEGKRNIKPNEVFAIKDDLKRLIKSAENLHQAFYYWCRRKPSESQIIQNNVITLTPLNVPHIQIPIIPDLAAFSGVPPEVGSQDFETEQFSGDWFADKALFYLRNNMLGFSAAAGSVAIVETSGDMPEDHSLVIAKYKDKYLARRLLRGKSDSQYVTLSAVSTDPRNRPPSLVVLVNEVVMFRVVGFLFNSSAPEQMSNKHDAIQIQDESAIKKIQTCHRLRDTSAEPLALENQLVLGGDELISDDFLKYKDRYVAVALNDGAGICKRIGGALPGELSHLCQFESIGGRGASEILSLASGFEKNDTFRTVETVREIIGVIYEF